MDSVVIPVMPVISTEDAVVTPVMRIAGDYVVTPVTSTRDPVVAPVTPVMSTRDAVVTPVMSSGSQVVDRRTPPSLPSTHTDERVLSDTVDSGHDDCAANNDSVAGVSAFTEQITRAKEGLVSASRHAATASAVQPPPPPCVSDKSSATDELWNEISLRVSQTNMLKIRDLDFSDLLSVDTSNSLHPPPCLLYTSPSPRDRTRSRMPSSA